MTAGGKREGAGRPALDADDGRLVTVSLRLPVWMADALEPGRSEKIRGILRDYLTGLLETTTSGGD